MDRTSSRNHKYNLRKRKRLYSDTTSSNSYNHPPALKHVLRSSEPAYSKVPLSKYNSLVRGDKNDRLRAALESHGFLEDLELRKLLNVAIRHQSEQCVQILLEFGANPNLGCPLLAAAETGNLSIMSKLLLFGAKVRVKDPSNGAFIYHKLVNAVSSGSLSDMESVFERLRQYRAPKSLVNSVDYRGLTPLVVALQRLPHNGDLVRSLVKLGAKLSLPANHFYKFKGKGSKQQLKNSPEISLLHHAVNHLLCPFGYCYCGSVIKTLVEICGVDIEIKNHLNMTPFLSAVYNNNLSAMKTLVALGADVFAVCDNWNMGALAIWLKYHPHTISTGLWLLQQGLDVNALTPDGLPIVSAVLNKPAVFNRLLGQPGLEEFLAQMVCKSSLASLNLEGTDPLFSATVHKMEFLVKLLLDRGTKVERTQREFGSITFAAQKGYVHFLQMLLCGLGSLLSTSSWRWAIRNALRMDQSEALITLVAIQLNRPVLSKEYANVCEIVNETNTVVESILSSPDTLKNSCRRRLWRSLPVGLSRSSLIYQLPLPNLLTNYLLLKIL